MILSLEDIVARYPGAAEPALRDVSLTLAPGELVGVVGPNGSGKTTLVRVALGVLPAERGRVTIERRDAGAWGRRDLARLIGVVSQREETVFPMRVRDAVALGRYPHLSPWGGEGAQDRAAVERALERCDVAWLADRWLATLSGGEWQRVRLARCLAQEPRALVLDEPTASLDLQHEMALFELVAEQVRSHGLAALVITHHVNLAARFADRLVLLDRGRIAAAGAPRDVLRHEVVEQVFRWPVTIADAHGAPQIVPQRRMPEAR